MQANEIELGAVITDIAAGPFGSNLKVSSFVDSGFPIIDGANLKGYKVTDNITKFVTEEKARSLHRSIAHRGDVVVTISGTVGQISYIPEDSQYSEYLCSQSQFRATFDTSRVYVPYLVFYFHTYEGQHKILSFANQTGVPALAQPLKNFRQIRLRLPEFMEQRKIASVIEKINDKIEKNEAINHNLQQQAIALFDSKFPCVSQGNRTIGEYIIPKRGRNLLSKDAIPGEIPVVAGGLEPATYHNCANTKAPVLTISASGANAGFVNLWNNPVWSSDSSYIDSSMSKDVYFWFVMLKKRQQEIFDSQTGSAQPHIYPQHIAAMPVCELNPLAVNEYTSLVSPLFASIGANQKENNRLAALRDALLPKLMSGEIDVSDVEI